MNRESDNHGDSSGSSGGNREMLRLLQAEIERLREELAAVRASDHPQRRTLIRERVARLDERQDALERIQALMAQAGEQA